MKIKKFRVIYLIYWLKRQQHWSAPARRVPRLDRTAAASWVYWAGTTAERPSSRAQSCPTQREHLLRPVVGPSALPEPPPSPSAECTGTPTRSSCSSWSSLGRAWTRQAGTSGTDAYARRATRSPARCKCCLRTGLPEMDAQLQGVSASKFSGMELNWYTG